ALGFDIDLKRLIARDWGSADTAERSLNVLTLDRQNDVVRRQAQFGEPIRVEPNPQRIIERAEQGDLPDTFDSGECVDDVDGCIIAQVNGVIRVLGRVNVDDL